METSSERISVGEFVRIYPRGSRGIWVADFWHSGRHCRRSLKTTSKKVAVQRALKLDAEFATGTYEQPPKNLAVGAAVDDYLAYLTTEGRAPKTISKYRGVLNVLTQFLTANGVVHLHHLSIRHVDQFRGERRKNHHPKTIYNEGVIVKQFAKWALSRKLVRENPVAQLKLVKPPLVPKEGPALEQINEILGVNHSNFSTMLAILAFTGMRSGELQRLRKIDLDLAGNWLNVVSRAGAETKTRMSRKVPIHPRLRPLLERLPKVPGQLLFAAAPSSKFPEGDHQIDTRKLNDKFKVRLKSLNLPVGREDGFVIHSLRHSFETICVNAGIPQRVIDAWLGHSADKSMGAVYYRLSDVESQQFMQRVPFDTGTSAPANKEEIDHEVF